MVFSLHDFIAPSSPREIISLVPQPLVVVDFEQAVFSPDIFSKQKKILFNHDDTARCEMKPHKVGLKRGVFFHAIWRRSKIGPTLNQIKADPAMPAKFADDMVPFMFEVLGASLADGGFALVTTPRRRHTENNFAENCCRLISEKIGVEFFEQCAVARSKKRIGAVFDPYNMPPQKNIIVFDDIITTGSTAIAIDNLLRSLGKNPIFFIAIDNKDYHQKDETA